MQRSEQLVQQGFIAPIKAESDRLATLGAQREVESAAAERRMATHDLEQAQASLGAVRQPTAGANLGAKLGANLGADAGARARESNSGFSVRAPTAGRVLRVLQTSEGAVALGTPLLEIGDTLRMEVVAELLTSDAPAAKTGSRVMIERWGGPAALQGQVRSVEPSAFTKVSALGVEEQRVRVLIDITSPQTAWQMLGDAYRVSVRIVTLTEANAVQVPVSAVFPLPAVAGPDPATTAKAADASDHNYDATANFAVFVVEDGRASQVPVVLGARNGSAAWIRNSITPGQQVIVYPPATVKNGLRVAARKP